jgi:hypothetical protein
VPGSIPQLLLQSTRNWPRTFALPCGCWSGMTLTLKRNAVRFGVGVCAARGVDGLH